MRAATATTLPDGSVVVTCGELIDGADAVGLDCGEGVAYVVPASRVRAVSAHMPTGQYTVPRSELRWFLMCQLACRLLDTAERAAILSAADEPDQGEPTVEREATP